MTAAKTIINIAILGVLAVPSAVGAARAVPNVRQADVEAYVADRLKAGAGAPVINRELATLKNFFNFAIARGLCKANPVRGIKPLPEARRPIKIIPYKVLDKYFDWCRENDPLLCKQMRLSVHRS